MSAPASPSKTQTPGPVKTSNPAKPSNPARAARRAMWAGWLEPVTTMMETRSPPLDRQALAAQLASLPPRAKNQKKWQVGFLAVVKQALQEGRAQLAEDFAQHRDGVIYVGCHAWLMDLLLQEIFRQVMDSQTEAGRQPQLAVFAIGGYGRGELAPFSDIDLLFVVPKNSGPRQTVIIETILYMLWDAGLKVGHAMRTIDECLSVAAEDITISTSLLETRFIAGHKALADRFSAALQGWIASQTPLDFVVAKLAERDARHSAHGASRYLVEPHIKEGKGGLRDLHTLFWIAKFAYRVRRVEDIVALGILRDSEARSFAASQRFLWTVRSFLHLRAGRADDRLAFDAQIEIAPQMGFHDRGGMRGVERFMKRYYLAARQVGNLTRIFCAAIESDFQKTSWFGLGRVLDMNPFRRADSLLPFTLEKGRLVLPLPLRFRDNPALIMDLFCHAQQQGADIHPDTFRRMTRAIRSRTSGQMNTAPVRARLLEILTSPSSPVRVLRLMNESGYLGKLLPDFGRIVGMMQFDMYHSYTVDEHTIQVVGMMHAIEVGDLKEEAPLASQMIHETHSRRALYMATFLHDIAKGRGGDHSVLGAEVARRLCPLFGLDEEETETAIWLVRWHLLFSKTAFRYDLNDPQTISEFAEKVQSPERLKLLLILTVADIRGVGPGVWNGWKASLMRTLFHRAAAVLGGAAPSEVAAEAAAEAMQETAEQLAAEKDWDDGQIDRWMQSFYPSYWASFEPDELLAHARLFVEFEKTGQPLCLDLRPDAASRTTLLTIIAQDHPGLFSRIAGAVAMAGCSIVSARINTRQDGTILDVFRLQDSQLQAPADPAQLGRLQELVQEALAGRFLLTDRLRQKTEALPRGVKAMKLAPRVIVTNKMSKTHTVIEVNGKDRPGLLYDITGALVQLGLQVNSASVSTYGEKAVDVFYVKDLFGLKLASETRMEQIREKLSEVLAGQPPKKPERKNG